MERSYRSLVPLRYTEEEFWSKYWQAREFYGNYDSNSTAGVGFEGSGSGGCGTGSSDPLQLQKHRDDISRERGQSGKGNCETT